MLLMDAGIVNRNANTDSFYSDDEEGLTLEV
jgi:hypothetical protein